MTLGQFDPEFLTYPASPFPVSLHLIVVIEQGGMITMVRPIAPDSTKCLSSHIVARPLIDPSFGSCRTSRRMMIDAASATAAVTASCHFSFETLTRAGPTALGPPPTCRTSM